MSLSIEVTKEKDNPLAVNVGIDENMSSDEMITELSLAIKGILEAMVKDEKSETKMEKKSFYFSQLVNKSSYLILTDEEDDCEEDETEET